MIPTTTTSAPTPTISTTIPVPTQTGYEHQQQTYHPFSRSSKSGGPIQLPQYHSSPMIPPTARLPDPQQQYYQQLPYGYTDSGVRSNYSSRVSSPVFGLPYRDSERPQSRSQYEAFIMDPYYMNVYRIIEQTRHEILRRSREANWRLDLHILSTNEPPSRFLVVHEADAGPPPSPEAPGQQDDHQHHQDVEQSQSSTQQQQQKQQQLQQQSSTRAHGLFPPGAAVGPIGSLLLPSPIGTPPVPDLSPPPKHQQHQQQQNQQNQHHQQQQQELSATGASIAVSYEYAKWQHERAELLRRLDLLAEVNRSLECQIRESEGQKHKLEKSMDLMSKLMTMELTHVSNRHAMESKLRYEEQCLAFSRSSSSLSTRPSSAQQEGHASQYPSAFSSPLKDQVENYYCDDNNHHHQTATLSSSSPVAVSAHAINASLAKDHHDNNANAFHPMGCSSPASLSPSEKMNLSSTLTMSDFIRCGKIQLHSDDHESSTNHNNHQLQHSSRPVSSLSVFSSASSTAPHHHRRLLTTPASDPASHTGKRSRTSNDSSVSGSGTMESFGTLCELANFLLEDNGGSKERVGKKRRA